MPARRLEQQVREFQRVMLELLKQYQFRDRNETVAYGLSVSQAYALRSLAANGPLTMGALAAALSLSGSTTTRVVDPLVRDKLVRRTQDSRDRRVWRAALTARGRSVWSRIERELLDIDTEVLRTLTASERDAVIRAMSTLGRATARWRAEKAAQR